MSHLCMSHFHATSTEVMVTGECPKYVHFCLWELILMTLRRHILLLSLIWLGHSLPPVQYHTRKSHYDTRIKYKQYEKKEPKQTFVSEQAWNHWKGLFGEVHIKLLSDHSRSSEDSFRGNFASELHAVSMSTTTKARTNYFFLTWETGQPVHFLFSPPILSVFCLDQSAGYLPPHPAPFYLRGKRGSLFWLFCLCSLVLTFGF